MSQPTPANVFTPPTALSQAQLAQQQQHIASLFQEGRLQEAEQAARTLTQRAPQQGFGWKALGLILSHLGRKDEALPAMQQAAKLLPRDAEAFNNLGALFREANQLDFALACYQHAVEVNPGFLPSLDNLIRLTTQMKRHQELLPLLKRKLALVPADADTLKQINQLEQAAGATSA